MPNRINVLVRKELADAFARRSHCVVVGHHGLSAQETVRLRANLREKDVQFRVLKNSLAERAFEEGGFPGLAQCLSGPCAILTGGADMPTACKAIRDWIKKNGKVEVRGGFLDGRTIRAEEVNRLADIPPMPVLQAQFLGALQGVPQRVASVFQSVLSSLARVLDEVRKQKEGPANAEPAQSE